MAIGVGSGREVLVGGAVVGDKYRIDTLIAEGGMSRVYAARDLSLDERVAIKVLKAEYGQDPEFLARFAREAKTLRRIQSEHCVKILEVDIDPTHGAFMVMEFLDGVTLRDILATTGKLTLRRACEFMLQICDALAVAHTNQCIHRDIKPENIVVVRRGELEMTRLIDFGISKHALTGSVLNQDLALVKTGNVVGTPQYMSPEQMRSGDIDARTDVWALGILLYELLAGRPPFVSSSVAEVYSMVIRDEPPALGLLEPVLPPEIVRIAHRCLRKAPADRFQNVGQLAVALMPFAPRRAQGCLERILSTLHAAGVPVDRSEVSDRPPPSGQTEVVTVPPNAPTPSAPLEQTIPDWDDQVETKLLKPSERGSPASPPGANRAPLPVTVAGPARMPPTMKIATMDASPSWKALALSAGAGILLAIVISLVVLSLLRRARDREASVVADPEPSTSVQPIERQPEPTTGSTSAALPPPEPRPAPSTSTSAAVAPTFRAPVPPATPARTPWPPAAPAPRAPPSTQPSATSKVRIIE
jgi:serine/threonine-protein kinase